MDFKNDPEESRVSVSCSVVSDSATPWAIQSMEFSRKNTGAGNLSLLQGILPTQGLNPGLPHCRQQADSLPAEPQGKNTGVGSLSLLQWIFPTQESNQGLPHCRRILYQLSYQGSQRKLDTREFRQYNSTDINFKNS